MLESILLVVAGILVIPTLYLGLYLVVTILNYRDSRRAAYKSVSSMGHMGSSTDIMNNPVKIKKVRKGYLVEFLDKETMNKIYTVRLDRIDRDDHQS